MLVFVLLAVVAFGGVLIFGGGSGSAQPAPIATVKVVTAAANVPLGTALDLPQLGTVDLPVADAVDTYTDPNQLVGKVVGRTVLQNEAFKSTDFQSAGGLSSVDLTGSLKAGQVAVAVSVDQLSGLGGLIQAGDFVDVPLTMTDQPSPPKAPVVLPIKDPTPGFPRTTVREMDLNFIVILGPAIILIMANMGQRRPVSEGPGPWSVRDSRTGTVVAERVIGTHSFWGRFRGLMGRAALPAGEGLYLADSSIHMFFMRFPIDALFVSTPDSAGVRRVVDVRGGLRPWTGLVMPVKGAAGAVELPAGTLERAGVQAGSAVRFEPVGRAGPGTSPAG